MKKLVILLLAVTLLVLCACSAKKEAAETTDGTPTYTVKVVDEKGDPISGAAVQLCSDSCLLGQTDDVGVVTFQTAEDDYKVSFVVLPTGYIAEQEEYRFDAGKREMTITLKKEN